MYLVNLPLTQAQIAQVLNGEILPIEVPHAFDLVAIKEPTLVVYVRLKSDE